jgi:hypothetical protein
MDFKVTHIMINDFIINYKEFPLAKKYKILKIELIAGQYIFIPSFWTHWIFTEPNSISNNYFINNIDIIYNDNKNKLLNSIIEKKPFIGKYDKYQINYDNYLKNNKNNFFQYVISDNKELAQVKKPYVIQDKHSSYNNLDYITNNFKDKYKYIHQINKKNDDVNNKKENFHYDIPNFNNILNCIKFNVQSIIWINFDKKIDSGNHYDDSDNFIYLLTGKKTIYLSPPGFNQYLYFSCMRMISTKYNL